MPEPMNHAPGSALTGARLRAAIGAAADYLAECAKAVDAINVYPVPDGDTGSNMAATLREACDYALALPEPFGAGGVLEALARGALYGGRGNSGVILSQALRGLAAGIGDAETVGGPELARGLEGAAESGLPRRRGAGRGHDADRPPRCGRGRGGKRRRSARARSRGGAGRR